MIHNPEDTKRGYFYLQEFKWYEPLEEPRTSDFNDLNNKKFYAAYLPIGHNEITPTDLAKAIYKICCYLEITYGFKKTVGHSMDFYLNTHSADYFKYNKTILPQIRKRNNTL